MNSKDKECWVQTFSGKKIFPLNPEPDKIDIYDMAHSLSNLCRFNGHCLVFYSIAQHSVLVSDICKKKYKLKGLLHDCSEAILSDIASPLKKTSIFEQYRLCEKKYQAAIYKKYGLSEDEPDEVKLADLIALSTEARDLLAVIHPEWAEYLNQYSPMPNKITPLPPKQAKELFLKRFNELIK